MDTTYQPLMAKSINRTSIHKQNFISNLSMPVIVGIGLVGLLSSDLSATETLDMQSNQVHSICYDRSSYSGNYIKYDNVRVRDSVVDNYYGDITRSIRFSEENEYPIQNHSGLIDDGMYFPQVGEIGTVYKLYGDDPLPLPEPILPEPPQDSDTSGIVRVQGVRTRPIAFCPKLIS